MFKVGTLFVCHTELCQAGYFYFLNSRIIFQRVYLLLSGIKLINS